MPSGDKPVYISGTFNNWSERIPLTLVQTPNPENPSRPLLKWECVVRLYPGTYAFRYIVDEQWKINEHITVFPDECGRKYNVISVYHEKSPHLPSSLCLCL